jgi:MoaA/NifB/PqqE/SkfB family radical SAM enzyme
MRFPERFSFTITNACNLRCKMCGQWSEAGYIASKVKSSDNHMDVRRWMRLVDEISEHGGNSILIRGGEPFLYPGIMDLLRHIRSRNIFTSIDTNGTVLGRFADEIVRLGSVHLTFSVDGPEDIHDQVRSVKGAFRKTKDNIARVIDAEKRIGQKISKSLTFTISPYSVNGLGKLPDVARDVGIETLCIVPYYYFPEAVGKRYESELRDRLDCKTFSWQGFHHDDSGVDMEVFKTQYHKFLESVGELTVYPYMPLRMDEYEIWFSDAVQPVGSTECRMIENLIDIQPDGDANFCVDFPDYVFGNVSDSSIAEVWNSDHAERFRMVRRKNPLAICHRCGAKYMAIQK